MLRVPFAEVRATLERALVSLGVSGERAVLAARLIAETDADGVSTHGVARFGRMAEMIRLGRIDAAAEPAPVLQLGALERWRGHRGLGNLAAYAAMQRAMELALEHGMGGVALADTTHWLRGGTYGWQAAEAGFGAMCWSNTLPNLPPWGATSPALGNNPFVLAVPRGAFSDHPAGRNQDDAGHGPVVLDMAMSQFSYGTLTKYRERGEALPVPGGYDEEGMLTSDAAAIEATQRALPIGYWKGSGLAFALDVLGAMLADGKATHEIGPDALSEVGQSQIFLAFSPQAMGSAAALREAIAFLHEATPVEPGRPARYPGERTLEVRAQSAEMGVPVPEAAWRDIVHLAEKGKHR